MKILIDNGHGSNTPGKCSPDGAHREYLWARDIAHRLEQELRHRGLDAERIVREDIDVPLKERCRRVNAVCNQHGAKNTLLVSIHNNAAGADGHWHNATGWSGFIAPRASQLTKKLAQLLWKHANAAGLRGNRAVPPEKYWVGNFYILRGTRCPAVLTENLFMDSKEDLAILQSPRGQETIVKLHADAIEEYVKAAL